MVIDRDPLVSLYDGTAVSHHVLLPPVMDGFPEGYKPSTDSGSMEERIQKAKNLVEEAGATGAELRMVYPNEPRPYLGKPNEIADLLRQQIEQIGLKVILEAESLKEVITDIANGAAPLVLIGWMGETGQPDDFWRPLLSGSGGSPSDSNAPRFYNAEVAAKIDAALKERDAGKRRSIYEGLEKSVHEDHRPIVPLLSAMQAMAWRSEVEGLFVDSTGTYRLYKAKYKGK
jgi:cationic peptide transport system substrate-binding protein